ncbi:MAG: hypothetical protein R6V54_04935 [Desulfobacteraceae bacterium]
MTDFSWITGVAPVELLIQVTGLLFYFRTRGRTLAEALATALVTTLLLTSLLQQTTWLLSLPALFPLPEAAALGCLLLAFQNRQETKKICRDLKNFLTKRHPVILTLLAACLGYIGLKALLFVPDTHHLAIFDTMTKNSQSSGKLAANAVIISNHFLRFGTVFGTALPGFMAYTAMLFATYALSRRYAWVPISFTVTAMAASIPQFVLSGAGPGFQIIPASVALFSLLLAYRLVETPNAMDGVLMVCSLGFLFSSSSAGFLMSLILSALFCLLIFRRHGLVPLTTAKHHWRTTLAAVVAGIFFSRLWYGFPPSLFHGVEKNREGLTGAAVSFMKYFIASMDGLIPLELFQTAVKPDHIMDLMTPHLFFPGAPFFSGESAAAAFDLPWFGPLAFLFVQPAVVYAMFRGPRRLKVVALALGAYIYLICLIPAWKPENVCYFYFFYALAGFFPAFLFPPWRLGGWAKRGLQILCFLVLFQACLAL